MTNNEIGFQRLLKSAAKIAIGSVTGNLLVFFIARALGASFMLPAQGTLIMTQVIMASLVGVLGAVCVYIPLKRFTKNASRNFFVIAVLFLLISFGGPLTTGADTGTVMALSLMHIITAVLCIRYISR